MNGVMFGALTEVHPDRIVVGTSTLFLRDGEACLYEIGTRGALMWSVSRHWDDASGPVKFSRPRVTSRVSR